MDFPRPVDVSSDRPPAGSVVASREVGVLMENQRIRYKGRMRARRLSRVLGKHWAPGDAPLGNEYSMITPRYLLPFDSGRALHRFTDVLVIGGGLAGLRAANGVESNQSVLVVTKDHLRESNSNYAQGGIAGVVDPDDCFESHVADTLAAGGNLCDAEIVDMVIREGPRRIEELARWGTQFDHSEGELLLGREGGHSRERIVHARGDADRRRSDAGR